MKTAIHIFKPSGKWYTSGHVDMAPFKDELIHVALYRACRAAYNNPEPNGWPMSSSPQDLLERPDDSGWMIVCLEPEHPHSHPIMLKSIPEGWR